MGEHCEVCCVGWWWWAKLTKHQLHRVKKCDTKAVVQVGERWKACLLGRVKMVKLGRVKMPNAMPGFVVQEGEPTLITDPTSCASSSLTWMPSTTRKDDLLPYCKGGSTEGVGMGGHCNVVWVGLNSSWLIPSRFAKILEEVFSVLKNAGAPYLEQNLANSIVRGARPKTWLSHLSKQAGLPTELPIVHLG